MGKHSGQGEGRERGREPGKHQKTPDRVVEDKQGFRLEEAGREERGIGNLQEGGRDD